MKNIIICKCKDENKLNEILKMEEFKSCELRILFNFIIIDVYNFNDSNSIISYLYNLNVFDEIRFSSDDKIFMNKIERLNKLKKLLTFQKK